MAKIINTIIQQPTAPKRTNVLWDDGVNLNIFRNGKWEIIGGGVNTANRLDALEEKMNAITITEEV